MKLSSVPRTRSSGSTQLRRLSPVVRVQMPQLLPNKRGDDAKVVDNQAHAVREAEKLLAGAQRVQLLAVAADKRKAEEIAAMWLQADGLEALDRALLLQLPVELDCFVEDLQSFVFPAPHSRAPSNHKCASGHCTTPFLCPRWGTMYILE